MVKLTVDGGPIRTTPTAARAVGKRGEGPRSPAGRRAAQSARRVLTRLAVFVLIPAVYVVVAALGRSVGLAPPAAAEDLSATGEAAVLPGRQLLWVDGDNCTPPAILEFPPDLFTRAQRRQGAAVLHALLACYLFVLFAVVCDDYFVPSIKKLCSNLRMSEDVAGATFMAVATSSPELFINLVGTFVTEGDIGVGAVVGSAVFNILFVPACCGIFAGAMVPLDWWPVTRDCIAYAVTVVLLIATLQDGRVEWYEALLLVCVYLLYLLLMCYNTAISRKIKSWWHTSRKGTPQSSGESSPLLRSGGSGDSPHCGGLEEGKQAFEDDDDISDLSLRSWPKDCGRWQRAWWVLVWPISVLLFLTVPDCRTERWKKWYPLTFLSCILWIALTSYVVAWMITAIGDTMQIPDSVMGLTFLAAGMSVPEAVSSVIVTKQGHGAMGISNSLGSNVFDILLCLGLPWLIKAAFFPSVPSDHGVIINSQGLAYSAVSLLSTLLALYATFLCNRFRLDWRVGVTCLLLYAAYLVFASLIELNVFFVVNRPTCAVDI